MQLTDKERGWLSIMRINDALGTKRVKRKIKIGRLHITYERRSKDNLWGRFGGGWNWHIGVEVGGKTVIVSLLVCFIRFYWSSNE